MFSKLFESNQKKAPIQEGGTVIDVRSAGEYARGHAPGSINIPLDQIQNKLKDLKEMDQPLLLCCASGARSNQATNFLAQQGLDVQNIGGWKNAC